MLNVRVFVRMRMRARMRMRMRMRACAFVCVHACMRHQSLGSWRIIPLLIMRVGVRVTCEAIR